jgi:hypothetical protein
MVFWLEFFEQIIKKLTPEEHNLHKMEFNIETPAADVQREFEYFINVKQHIGLLRDCIKFALIMDDSEKKHMLEATQMQEKDFVEYRIKLPKTAQELIILCGAYPIGVSHIHRYLYKIIENDSYRLLQIIDTISEKLYFNTVTEKMAAVWRNDEDLPQIIEHIQQMYGVCQRIYHYHKKNNWDTFRENYDEPDEIF